MGGARRDQPPWVSLLQGENSDARTVWETCWERQRQLLYARFVHAATIATALPSIGGFEEVVVRGAKSSRHSLARGQEGNDDAPYGVGEESLAQARARCRRFFQRGALTYDNGAMTVACALPTRLAQDDRNAPLKTESRPRGVMFARIWYAGPFVRLALRVGIVIGASAADTEPPIRMHISVICRTPGIASEDV